MNIDHRSWKAYGAVFSPPRANRASHVDHRSAARVRTAAPPPRLVAPPGTLVARRTRCRPRCKPISKWRMFTRYYRCLTSTHRQGSIGRPRTREMSRCSPAPPRCCAADVRAPSRRAGIAARAPRGIVRAPGAGSPDTKNGSPGPGREVRESPPGGRALPGTTTRRCLARSRPLASPFAIRKHP